MKCKNCEKQIEKGYKYGVDMLCSKKCLWVLIKDETSFSVDFCNKEEAYTDKSVLDAQQVLFDEDRDYVFKEERD